MSAAKTTWADALAAINTGPAAINAALGARGKAIIAAAETRTANSYGKLATADEVTGLILPTDGLIEVDYYALWSTSVTGNVARAAIFLNDGTTDTQLKVGGNNGTTYGVQTQAAMSSDTVGNKPVVSCASGLIGLGGSAGWSGDPVTTGEAIAIVPNAIALYQELGGAGIVSQGSSTLDTPPPVGGSCKIFAAAGTYTVSIQFKTSTGTLTVSNRHLWVKAVPFG